MEISKISKEDVLKAMEKIDEKGVPTQFESKSNYLIGEGGKLYPPKYVVALARSLKDGSKLSTEDFNTIEANKYLKGFGYDIRVDEGDEGEEVFEITVTASGVSSTDTDFTMDDLTRGDAFKFVDAYFQRGSERIVRYRRKGELRASNQTFPRLVMQVFESELLSLSKHDKANFPICQYKTDDIILKGIYSSVEEFKEYRNTLEFVQYHYGDDKMMVIYCWNVFSTLVFSQECLKRFGKSNEYFVLKYTKKPDKNKKIYNESKEKAELESFRYGDVEYKNEYSKTLIISKNIIFRGAPGDCVIIVTGCKYVDNIRFSETFNKYETLCVA